MSPVGKWRLKRTKQCEKCPWRVDVDPNAIPNGYDVEKHKAISVTIADADEPMLSIGNKHVMACHETENAYCVGWLMNQLGPGNNIGLRLRMVRCENSSKLKLLGEQHERFEDTIPR